MTISKRLITLGLTLAGIAAAEPAFSKNSTARNAASRIPAGLPGHGVAPGSRMVLEGKGLGPEAEAKDENIATRVKITIAGAEYETVVLAARANRVETFVPSDVPVGRGQVRLEYQGAAAETTVEITPVAFGVYTRSQQGTGTAVARHYDSQAAITPAAAARRGETITVVGTGAGAGDQPVEVLLGGTPVGEVGFSRLDQGVDELSFVVPGNTATGCAVPLVVKIGETYSNFATLPVSANGGTCPAENGLTAEELERIERAGGARVGTISFSRQNLEIEEMALTADQGLGYFRRTVAADFSGLGANGWALPAGQCLVATASESEEGEDGLVVEDQPLDAGADLSVSGPRGARRLKKERDVYTGDLGQAFALPPGTPTIPGMTSELFLEPGTYTVTGPGGRDIGSFTANFRVSPAINWSNRAAVSSIDRGQDLRIVWQGGGASDLVTIFGGSASGNNSASFVCVEKASKGAFTVPAMVLSRLPASAEAMLSLQAGPVGEGTRFQASGLDFGWITATSGASRTVVLR